MAANIAAMDKAQLKALHEQLQKEYDAHKAKGLKLDMSRGRPATDQLDLANDMMDVLNADSDFKTEGGVDTRNYGGLEGIPEARKLMGDLLGVQPSEVIIGGNASLNLMYDAVARGMLFGVTHSDKPWGKYEKIKFLCPVPGYDRHFGVTQDLGVDMINIPMHDDGPDMDMIEKLVAQDETIKGIWCVPKYSNPDGVVFSDDCVRRFANLKPAAKDFKIFWDNAYCIHFLYDNNDKLLNILDECKKAGSPDMVYIFASTSKISYAGGGISCIAASEANIKDIVSHMTYQTIGHDKVNQLRHVRYFKNLDGIVAHMHKLAATMAPKFEAVLQKLDTEFTGSSLARWVSPRGGYFIGFTSLVGSAKRIVALCKEAGVVMTPAGAPFPYGNDPDDATIRIAPSLPPVAELQQAIEVFCTCVKLAAVEKLLA